MYKWADSVCKPKPITRKENTDYKDHLLPCGYTHSWERFQESTPRGNPDSESLRQFVAVFSNDPGTMCISTYLSTWPFQQHGIVGTCCMGNSLSSMSSYPNHCVLERLETSTSVQRHYLLKTDRCLSEAKIQLLIIYVSNFIWNSNTTLKWGKT